MGEVKNDCGHECFIIGGPFIAEDPSCPVHGTNRRTGMKDIEFEPTEEDRDPSNVHLRAGYLMGMAMKLPPGDDRTFLTRASRSLRAYAETLLDERSR